MLTYVTKLVSIKLNLYPSELKNWFWTCVKALAVDGSKMTQYK